MEKWPARPGIGPGVGGGCLMTQLPRAGASQVAQDGGSAAVTKKEETSLPQGEETAVQAGAARRRQTLCGT